MGDDEGSDTGYDLSDGEWLSYAELATRRGIDRQSAFKLAARHRWRRQKGNTGQVRVFVPSAFAEPEDTSSDTRYDLSHHLAAFETALVAVKDAHQREIQALERQLAEAAARTDRAEQAVAGERTRADALRDRLQAAQADAQQAQQVTEALRQAETARKARGRLRRAWDGWRGR